MTALSIIIVTYNSADEILSCFNSFGPLLTESSDLDIIVVDNASSDNTVSLITQKYPTVILIENKINKGFACAINQGIAASKSNTILILNPDTRLSEEFFPALSGYLHQQTKPAVVGCRLLNIDGTPQVSTWKVPNLLTFLLEMVLPYSASLPLVTEQPIGSREVSTVTGAAMVFNREIAKKLCGFDEKYFMYIEDLDFCIRAKKAGYLIYFLDSARVYHLGGKSSLKSMETFYVNYYSSKLYYFKKHYSAFTYSCALVLLYIGCVARIISYAIVGSLIISRQLRGLSKDHIFALKKIFHS